MEAQSTFLAEHPVAERIHLGVENGQPIVIEYIPVGQLPESFAALELPDGDVYFYWRGEDGQRISCASYQRMKAQRAQV